MHIIIIGNGITGVTAAITIRKLKPEVEITIISSESDHFYARTALMYLYMGHLRYQNLKVYEDWFWAEHQLNLLRAHVTTIDFDKKEVVLDNNSKITYNKLILAIGSEPRQLIIPGEQLAGVQGLYSLQDLENLELYTKNMKQAVVIGGGLIGIELAEMLITRCVPVTFLVRENHYWGNILPAAEADLIALHIREHGIDLRLNTTVKEITGDNAGRVQAVITNTEDTIPADWVGVAVGVKPNIQFLQGSALKTNLGILVNAYLETNIPDVFAAGDCAELSTDGAESTYLEQLWYTGRMQGETVAHTVCGNKTAYQRGVWFNSAKFFDLEYQTYGRVAAKLATDEETIVWQHAKQKKLIRINYHSVTRQVLGFNLLGIRYRHDVCEQWIRQGKDISYVLQHLHEANFDSEFYPRYEKEIKKAFSQQLSAINS